MKLQILNIWKVKNIIGANWKSSHGKIFCVVYIREETSFSTKGTRLLECRGENRKGLDTRYTVSYSYVQDVFFSSHKVM